MINVNKFSYGSFLIEQYNNDTQLGTASGFIFQKDGLFYLATNRHVVTGKHNTTGSFLHSKLAQPNILKVYLPVADSDTWHSVSILLYSNSDIRVEDKIWLEHQLRDIVDVVLIPITMPEWCKITPFSLDEALTNMIPEPAMRVSIIGFPLGKTGGGKLPIWVSGFIATEPSVDIEGLPKLYVNAPGRSSLSGSPVVLSLSNGYRMRNGIEANAYPQTQFIGIYSGRLNPDEDHWSSDICIVWKPIVFGQILNSEM